MRLLALRMFVMTPQIIDDLKQFITTTVLQATANLPTREEMRSEILASEARLEAHLEAKLAKRLDALQSAIADAITVSNDAHDSRLDDHEYRLKKLERRSA